MMIKSYSGNVGVQLAADIVSLAVLLPPATFFLTGQPAGPDFVIPLVIVWSYIAIAVELRHPTQHPKLLMQYGLDAMVAVRDASYFFAGIVILMLIPRVVIWMAQECCTITVLEVIDGGEEDQDATDVLSPIHLNGTPLHPPYTPPAIAATPNSRGGSNNHRRVSFYNRLQVEEDGDEEEGEIFEDAPQ